MTKVILNGATKGLRGKIGNLIYRLPPDGTTVVTSAPPKKTSRQKKRANLKRSASQKAHNGRFQEASAYAKWAAREQPVYAQLAAVAPMKTAYNFALCDWFHPPVIHRIERRAGCILVEASDNVRVTRVQVTVLDGPEGSVLEKGEALKGEGDWWKFAFQSEGKTIIAEAWDLPGHVTKLSV